jgi:alcohol-forming fatty acyl-CoA reductase
VSTGTASVRAAFRGKTVLVTGFTGFVGKVLVAFLLDRAPEIERVVLLARGRRGQSVLARVKRIVERSPCFRPLREHHGAGLGAFLQRRLGVIEGDVRTPMWGLDAREARSVLSRIDVVIHAAGLTDFVPDPRDGVSVNVRGALHAADVAACTRGKRLVHVSTCFVAGRGSRRVAEELTHGLAPNGTRFDPESMLVSSTTRRRRGASASKPARGAPSRWDGRTSTRIRRGWPSTSSPNARTSRSRWCVRRSSSAPARSRSWDGTRA